MSAIVNVVQVTSMGVKGILQYISPTELIPSSYQTISAYLAKLSMVVDWMKRSMFHHGATAALAIVLLHYPRDLELNDVTKGFASDAGPITMERVKELLAKATSFADRVLVAADFMPYQASQEAPGDLEPKH
jgi:hypothetical protein